MAENQFEFPAKTLGGFASESVERRGRVEVCRVQFCDTRGPDGARDIAICVQVSDPDPAPASGVWDRLPALVCTVATSAVLLKIAGVF